MITSLRQLVHDKNTGEEYFLTKTNEKEVFPTNMRLIAIISETTVIGLFPKSMKMRTKTVTRIFA